MFEKMTNQELKAMLLQFKVYVDRRIIAVIVVVAMLIVGYYSVQAQVQTEETVLTPVQRDTSGQVVTTPAPETLTTLVPVEIGHRNYDPMWEYLEYGETVEYFHPEGTLVSFSFKYKEIPYLYETVLEPPQYRAFLAKFPSGVYWLKDGYKLNVTISGNQIQSVNWIEDSFGNKTWDPSMKKGPRSLNTLEEWSISYARTSGYDHLLKEWFDILPECDVLCKYWHMSPAEEKARSQAFFNYVVNPDNNVWVEIWLAVDGRYRWIDSKSGVPLELLHRSPNHIGLYQLPQSGWVGLQVTSSAEEPFEWESTYEIKVSPGFAIGIDQASYVAMSGRADWILNQGEMAGATDLWLPENIMANLKPY